MSAYATGCLVAGGGVTTADPNGCSQTLTLEAELQQQINGYTLSLSVARNNIQAGEPSGMGGAIAPPSYLAQDMQNQATVWCQMFPGTCPSTAQAVANQYAQALLAVAASYGFKPDGTYDVTLDNQDPSGLIAPDFIQSTPLAPNPNVTSYSPSAGYRLPIDSEPPSYTPTSPAFTSPSNVQSTAPSSPAAASGGATVAGTASGAGPTQGGAQTQQSVYSPSPVAAATASNASPVVQNHNTKLLLVLAAVLVLVLIAGK